MLDSVKQNGHTLKQEAPEHKAVAPHHAAPLEAARQDGYEIEHTVPEHMQEADRDIGFEAVGQKTSIVDSSSS